MKITSTKCFDGKPHTWIVMHQKWVYGVLYRFSWCSKCGSNTEFRKNCFDRWTRLKDENELYIKYPLWIKQMKK